MILICLMKWNYKDHLSYYYNLFLTLHNITDTLGNKSKFQRNGYIFNCYFSSDNVDRSHLARKSETLKLKSSAKNCKHVIKLSCIILRKELAMQE